MSSDKTTGHFEREAHYNSFFVLLPLAVGIPITILVPMVIQNPRTISVVAIALGISGFALFTIAKSSMFKQGHWLTWGSSKMSPRNRTLYRLGYGLILLSGLISCAIPIAGKML